MRPTVCIVGAGGREHALAVALARTADVVITPGNPAMEATARAAAPGAAGTVRCSDADPGALDADLWVIGPEAPLVDGLADRLRAGGRLVLGPGADGARLEGSKAWMKDLLTDAGVPTAAHRSFDAAGPAIEYLRSLPAPWVVKTDGLAAGKGVLVTDDRDAAEADVAAKLAGTSFGAAGRRVVIEEGLVGEELSILAVCDGRRAVALAPAQDFKRAGEGDTGPNTGGMGAYSPVPGAGDDVVARCMDEAILPTLAALAERGIDYRGVLYAGLMLTAAGPKVIEFNVRFGDPEIEAVAARWQGDVAELLTAAAAGRLDTVAPPTFSSDAAVCVVLAAAGYPAHPRFGDPIDGLDAAGARPGVAVHPAGVALHPAGASLHAHAQAPAPAPAPAPASASPDPAGPGRLVTAGGRVVAVRALGPTVAEARQRAYEAADLIRWPGRWYRHDIARLPAARQAIAEERP
ncbi:MAG TPA: phosphoribosylamine--glycine ligase [Acidimicrobiales bacterium]|nr:phosphoribosylamine--glycine ligase [Acidimicrobiales bacterium]